jgi:hypothetical protein
MFSMNTAPKTGQRLLLMIGTNEWCSVGYYDQKLGWVVERKQDNPKAGVVKVTPKGWEPCDAHTPISFGSNV